MSSDGSKAVKLANKKTAKQLTVALENVNPPDGYTCKVLPADELPKNKKEQIWSIIEDNMRDLYVDSSMGWNPPEKLKELFDPLARFIVVSPVDNPDKVEAYCTFRFEYEEEEDLVYCYELQINRLHQRKGIGRFLVNSLEAIGRNFRMGKIMLTVFDKNVAAIDFYSAMHFNLDPCSPSYHEDGKGEYEEDDSVDYQILSKTLV